MEISSHLNEIKIFYLYHLFFIFININSKIRNFNIILQ